MSHTVSAAVTIFFFLHVVPLLGTFSPSLTSHFLSTPRGSMLISLVDSSVEQKKDCRVARRARGEGGKKGEERERNDRESGKRGGLGRGGIEKADTGLDN